ncbi:hypothetical protein F5Y10DRAFT_289351 [Nemania abortiva]|nr:hypothetical protein F5Y10DRAFT_289351 [Nemania abortiva]
MIDELSIRPGVRANNLSSTDLNPILQVTTWLLLSIVTLLLAFRLLTRFYIRAGKPFGWEDALIIISYFFGVGEYITVLVPQGNVIGKEIMGIPVGELEAAEKATYARNLLFILCLGCSKLSVSASLLTLSPKRTHRRMMHGLQLFIVLWIISSFLGVAFQCGTRGPWDKDIARCSDQKVFLTYVAIFNIFTDAALIGFPVAIIYPLKMLRRTRLTVLSFYMVRVLAVAATITQLVYLPDLFEEDFTFQSFTYYITMQLAEFTSVTASCAVYFWPLFQSLQSGLMLANSPEHSHQHPSSKQTKLTLPYSQPSMASQDSNRRDRGGYIEITTDIDVHHITPARCTHPINHSSWELNELQRPNQDH